jgi:hypothetical protein
MGEWSEPLGLASMVAESLVVFVTAAVLVTRQQPVGRAAGAPISDRTTMQPGPAVG